MRAGTYLAKLTDDEFEDECSKCERPLEGHGHLCEQIDGIYCCECFQRASGDCRGSHKLNCETIVDKVTEQGHAHHTH